MNILKLERELITDEGWRSKPYLCSKGYPTIGVGHKLLPHEMHLKEVSTDWIWGTLRADVMLAIRGCEMIFGRSRFQRMADPRQRALANMVFQMGTQGVADFDDMVRAIFREDWAQAYIEALDSKWAKKDTPNRARRVAEMLRTGMERKEVRA